MGSETWRYWVLAALTFGCVSCEDDPCQEVATLLRACCARGPAELRASCQSDANLLEQDGNSDACEKALNRGTYAVCQP